MSNRPIGIFDSGVGGLTILSEIRTLLPNETFIYVADQANVPYGAKNKAEIERLTQRIAAFLISRDVKLIVIACNTATVYSIDYLRNHFNIPFIGVVPVIKTLVDFSKTKKTAVIATPSTAKSPYLKELIKKYSNGVPVAVVGETGLEMLVEKGNLENPQIEKAVQKYLVPLVEQGIDTIALGCTHYSFIKEKIQEMLGKNVTILDSGAAVARQVRRVLDNSNSLADKKGEDWYYTTGDVKHFRTLAENLLRKKIDYARHIDI